MARTDALKDALLATDDYAATCDYGALFTADPGTTGTAVGEVAGGSYVRLPLTWGPPAAGLVLGERAIVAAAAFDVPAGTAPITHVATCSAVSGSTVMDVTPCVPVYGTQLTDTVLNVTFTSNEGG